jgi:hypothetical protein
MKISVVLALDIDEEAWTLNYGVTGKEEIREDVRIYVINGVHDHLQALGLLAPARTTQQERSK